VSNFGSDRESKSGPTKIRSKPTRLEYINETVQAEGFVSVDDLSQALHVSKMTVHRDLDELQRQGSLRKIRGGASAYRSTQFESDLEFRVKAAISEKQRIAAAGAQFTEPGDVVILDDSTTVLQILPFLEERTPLTIITNFLPALNKLSDHPSIKVLGLGGQYVPRYAAFLGMVCEQNLQNLFADVSFISTSSLRNGQVYHQDQQVLAAKKAMLRASSRRVLLMDHTKIGQPALYKLGDINDFDYIVVDAKADESEIAQLRESGTNVIVA